MMIRALTLRKRFSQLKHKNNWWALVGHFDEMECSELTSMTLSDISNFNDCLYKKDSASTYHHVIFLIDSGLQDDYEHSDNILWDTGKDFLSVTRIHFPDTINWRRQFEELRQYFEKISSSPKYENIIWRTYYTMELSDMVLVSRSCSLQLLSHWALLVTKTKLVGSAYTYFCVPGTILDEDSEQWPDSLNKDFVDFLAIRFSVQGSNVDEELKNIQTILGKDYTNSPFRIAGNEDAIICGNDVPVQNLLKLYQSWYRDESKILKYFRDIITRIGAEWTASPPNLDALDYDRSETTLEKYSKAILNKVQDKILSNDALTSKEWLRPLVELTTALVHMSHSAILDEPVVLILPALNAFWDNVLAESSILSDETMYLRFAELCIHTMEHLMRAEGQLSQRPEMRPLTYDMPVFVLEYATAFLLTLDNRLTRPDGPKAKRIRFLLVPSAEIDVSTEEPFAASDNATGLLQTTVPFSLLYKPERLLPALCHEMAHYVGESIRLREIRYWCFLQSTAKELTRYFFNNVTDKSNHFQEYLVNSFLNKSLRIRAEENGYCSGANIVQLPLLTIVELINELVTDLINEDNYDAYAELVRNYVFSGCHRTQLYSFPQLILEDRCQPFAHRLDDLFISYREAYADICMLYFLKLSPMHYLEVAMHRWEDLNTGMLLRAYVSLYTAEYSREEIHDAFERWGKREQICGESRDWVHTQLSGISELLHRKEVSAEHYLAEYLGQCWQGFSSNNLDKKVDDSPYTVKEIYDKLMGINTDTQYQDILEVIDYGRQIVLKQLVV